MSFYKRPRRWFYVDHVRLTVFHILLADSVNFPIFIVVPLDLGGYHWSCSTHRPLDLRIHFPNIQVNSTLIQAEMIRMLLFNLGVILTRYYLLKIFNMLLKISFVSLPWMKWTHLCVVDTCCEPPTWITRPSSGICLNSHSLDDFGCFCVMMSFSIDTRWLQPFSFKSR